MGQHSGLVPKLVILGVTQDGFGELPRQFVSGVPDSRIDLWTAGGVDGRQGNDGLK